MSAKTSVSDLVEFYRNERRLFGRCPSCSAPFRLSDVKITYGKEPPRDVLTAMKRERDRLSDQIAELEEQLECQQSGHENEVATLEAAHEARREEEVANRVDKVLKEARADAIARSKVTTLGKTIERIAPMFSGFGHHPGDVRPIYQPLDFLVFSGLFAGTVTDIVFVEFKTGSSALSPVQKSIRDAVSQRRVRFEERRINSETMRKLCAGTQLPAGRSVVELAAR